MKSANGSFCIVIYIIELIAAAWAPTQAVIKLHSSRMRAEAMNRCVTIESPSTPPSVRTIDLISNYADAANRLKVKGQAHTHTQ